MAKLRKVFQRDTEAVETGVWQTLYPADAPGGKPFRVKVRSIHARRYREGLQKIRREFNAQFIAGDGILKPAAQDAFDIEVCVRCAVVDWDGAEDDGGKEIPFSQEALHAQVEEHRALRHAILGSAASDENYKTDEQRSSEREAMAGNSERPSSTSTD